MATKTIQQILKSHEDLVRRVGEQMQAVTKGKKPSNDFVLREEESLLARLKDRAAKLKKARDDAIQRYEVELQVNGRRIAELEKRIKEGREALKTKPKKPTKPKGPTDKVVVKQKVDVKKKVKPKNKAILKKKTKTKKKPAKKK